MATQRVVFPGMPAHYTTVEVRPGDCEIATKTDLEVTVQFGGRPPTDAQVERRDADGNWKADGLTQTGPRSFSYRFQDVRGDFTYRVRGNDALSPDYQVRTYTPPEMAAMEVEIVPPAYAQIPSARSIGGNVTALRGSELHWRLLSTVPLAKAGFHFKDGQPGLDLNAENPQSWLGSLTLQKNAAYRVALLDLKNRPGREGDEFHLVALPDAPPSVEISSPEPNITTGPQDKVTIQVRADDDIGLAGVDLVSQKPGSPKQTVPIVSGDKLGRHVKGSIVLDLAPLNLKPYDVVMFYAEARDNNTYDGPGMARSSVHFVTIGSPDQGPASGGGGGGGQEVNLMQLQRDLISATSGLPASASRSTLADLGASQYEIRGYAEKLLALLQSLGAPPDAITAMNAAIENMNQAEKNLNAGESVPAVDQEGQALANLYQVARLLSASMAPGQESSQLKILLEDLRKARQERQEQAQNEISAALAQTLALLNAQEALQQGASGKGEGKGQGAGNDPNGSPGQNNPELARQQQELADKARALAERLSRAAGNNPSLSHRVGEEAGSAADRMGAAAEGLRGGEPPDSPGVSAAQAQGVDALSHVAQSLDQLSKKTENNADVKEEGAPPEYSDQLSRYYQKLSHEK